VLGHAIGQLLPAAAAVALSPIPIVGIVLVLDGPGARKAGPAFAVGWVGALAVVSTVVVLVAGNAKDPTSDTATGVNWLLAAIGALFLVMAARQWQRRPKDGEAPETPGWMATVESASPVRAFVLGAALAGANPKNLALTLAASASIAEAGLDGADTAIAIAVFVILGSLTVVGAVVFHLVAPKASAPPLASVRRFMSDNNATIMMVILLILGLKILGDALGGLWT
jgi:threonine/homoserine/homoserine lactone efflux protein